MRIKQVNCPHCGRGFRIRIGREPVEDGRYRLTYVCPGCGRELSEPIAEGRDATEERKGPSLFYLLCLPFEILTLGVFFLGILGLFTDLTPLFTGLDRLVGRALEGGVLVLNAENLSFLARIFVVMCCFCVHECAHALVAFLLGDDTGKRQGRISLNPSRHLEPIGALATLFVGIGYAKPVPVNIQRFRSQKVGFALTSAAGPLSNLCMALLLLWMSRGISFSSLQCGNLLWQFLVQAAYINVSLAVFNLLPIPPLDGSRLAFLILPDKAYQALMRSGNRLLGFLMIGLLLLGRLGYYPFSALTEGAFGLLYRWALPSL